MPSAHQSVFFANIVSFAMQETVFTKVFLEIPIELESYFHSAHQRLPIPTLVHPHGDTLNLEMLEQSYVVYPGDSIHWAAYLATQHRIPVEYIDTHLGIAPDFALPVAPAELQYMSWQQIFSTIHFPHSTHLQRTKVMYSKICENLSEETPQHFLVVCGMYHFMFIYAALWNTWRFDVDQPLLSSVQLENYAHMLQSISPQNSTSEVKNWNISDIHPHSLYHMFGDLPYLVENFVNLHSSGNKFEFLSGYRSLFLEAHQRYKQMYNDTISTASFLRLFQYLRNLSYVQAQMLPTLQDVISAAKSVAEDDYAYEVYKLAISFLFLPAEDQKLDRTMKLHLPADSNQFIRLTFKRRLPRPILQKQRYDPFDTREPLPEEKYPGHWTDIWDTYSPYGTVSYPPEDEYIENYFHFLRKRAQEVIMEEKAIVEPFQSTIEDGIDWTETIRHYHEKKIFVKRIPRQSPDIGALIVQFIEFQTEEFSHHSILYAEHDQESDISIVSTNPGDTIIGPGITRIKLGGVISVFPPTGYATMIPRGYDDLKTRLLYTAMNMATSPLIVLVAERSPTPEQRYLVRSAGFRLLFIPMQQLTKTSLHRLRTFHLLAHRDLRDIAREYIGY